MCDKAAYLPYGCALGNATPPTTAGGPRVDIFGIPHGGYRHLLSALMVEVGRTHWASESERTAAIAFVRRALVALDEHAEHEDHIVLPVVEEKLPEHAAEWKRQHVVYHAMAHDVSHAADAVDAVLPSDAAALCDAGARLAHTVNLFVAYNIMHMGWEEASLSPALWEAVTPDVIIGWHGAIGARLKPEEAAMFTDHAFKACTPSQVGMLLGGMKHGMPEHVYAGVRAKAVAMMGEERFQLASAAVGGTL